MSWSILLDQLTKKPEPPKIRPVFTHCPICGDKLQKNKYSHTQKYCGRRLCSQAADRERHAARKKRNENG